MALAAAGAAQTSGGTSGTMSCAWADHRPPTTDERRTTNDEQRTKNKQTTDNGQRTTDRLCITYYGASTWPTNTSPTPATTSTSTPAPSSRRTPMFTAPS